MVKFEVGKIYKATNVLGVKVYRKVIARTERFLITYTRNNDGGIPVWDGEGCHLISVVNGVEVCMDAFYNQKLSADKEASIEELEEEMKKYEKPEENKDSDDWIVGKEYEAICLDTKQRFKVKLAEIHEDDLYPLTFKSNIPGLVSEDDFDNYGDVIYASDCGNEGKNTVIVFKHGIKSILDWEEVKKDRELVCFEVGKEYITSNGEMWECKAVFDANNRRVGVFYNKDTDVNIIPTIKTHNSIEYTLCGNLFNELNFIADEQYRDEIKALL